MLTEIANHLWQSTLFVVLVALSCQGFRKDGAHVRYWLWWAASVKFLVPFSLLTAIGALLGNRAAVSVPDAWANTVTVVARPFAADPGLWTRANVLLALWAAGSLAIIARWIWQAYRLRRVLAAARAQSLPLIDGPRSISVFHSEARVEPGVVGILRAALILPANLEQRLSRAQLEAVLAHELCHIRRRDNLTAAVHMLVEALFWFHPLVWWVGARLIDERERACDEMVVALGHDRQTYAASILDVCEHYVASPLRCAAGISGSDLKRRITKIMRYEGMTKLIFAKKLALGVAVVGLVAIPVVAGLSIQQPAMAQDPAAPLPAPAADAGGQPSSRAQSVAQDPAAPLPAPAADAGGQPSSRAQSVTTETTAGGNGPSSSGQTSPSRPAPGDTSEPTDYEPIVMVAPLYPRRAAAQGVEGYVVVRYTVAADGSVQDASVVESSSTLFDRAAIDSVLKYKYRPRLIDGQPISVPGVTTKIAFVLDHGDVTVNPTGAESTADDNANQGEPN